MNAQMRRIDLLCKMLGPLFIALIDGVSTELAIIVNFAMNVASVVVEYYAIARVYYNVPELQGDKQTPPIAPPPTTGPSEASATRISQLWQSLRSISAKSVTDTKFYIRHRAFLPSFAGALLYLTVLSFNGQMGTYLLSAGYSATEIASARMLSVAFEVLATWVAPWLMDRIGPVRAGLWLSSSQVSMLAAGTTVFWLFQDQPLISATGLVGGTILSRVGLRGFDLCIQLIVQEVSCSLRMRRRPRMLRDKIRRADELFPGRGSREPRSLLLGRGGVAERVRASLVRVNHRLLPPRPVQVALVDFGRGRGLGECCVHPVRLLPQRPPVSPGKAREAAVCAPAPIATGR